MGLEGLDPEGHRQIRLTRPGRPDAEGDDVVGDGVGVALLSRRLRTHRPTPRRAEDLGGEDLRRTDVVLHHDDGPADIGGVESLTLFEQDDELVEQSTDTLGVVAFDADLVSPGHDADVGKCLFDQPQQLVALSEQPHHEVVPGNEDLDLSGAHPESPPRGRPPRTWRWRWATLLAASSPTLNTSR